MKKTIKEAKTTKGAHTFKNHAHAYNVEILNSFNEELQLKNSKLTIKIN